VTVGSATKTTNYYYSGNHVIEERDGSDNVLNQYIYGNGIDEILRMDKYNGTSSTPYYFHTNGIGSVTAITDANGDLVERISYDTFGMPTFTDAAGEVVSKSTISNTLLFHGRRYDAETNLYYFRARYYDPIMGRFLQTDPMGYADSMNLYQGFNMNPINFVDPFGNEFTREQVDEIMTIRRDQGLNVAKNFIDRNRTFTNADKLALHMKLLFGVYDPEKIEAEKYKTNFWTVMGDTLDGMAYDTAGRTYSKLASAALNHDGRSFVSFLADLAIYGTAGGVLRHYVPMGIEVLKSKYPILNESVGNLVSKGSEKVKNFFNKIFGGGKTSGSGYVRAIPENQVGTSQGFKLRKGEDGLSVFEDVSHKQVLKELPGSKVPNTAVTIPKQGLPPGTIVKPTLAPELSKILSEAHRILIPKEGTSIKSFAKALKNLVGW
jgi:RHS repeat-associated protein